LKRGRADPIASQQPNYLVDTDVFILWQHDNRAARQFFRRPPGRIYYAKQTRKELLHPFLSDRERRRFIRLLKRFRRVNPDEKITTAFSDLLARYP
jgi:predicted nucleic acid-binding protein